MPLLPREQAITRFPTLDPKTAKTIPNIREAPELLDAQRKLADLEGQLVAVCAEIAEAEKQPKATRGPVDLDAERILQGEPLEAQPPAGDLAELRRRQTAIKRAVELQNQAIAETFAKLGREACDQLAPVAAKYQHRVLDALDALRDSLEGLNCFSGFLASKGVKGNLRPRHWEPSPIEHQLVNLIETAAAWRRDGLARLDKR